MLGQGASSYGRPMTTASYRNFTGTAAENYERHFVPAIAEPVSAPLLEAAALRAGERVLDIACGTGVIARHAAELVGPTGSVTAVDVAPDMIEVARATPAPAAPAIDWRTGDAASLPLPDGGYDVVLCQMGLMFVEDRSAALSEVHRVLAAGGRVVVSTPGDIQRPFAVLEQAIVDHVNADLGGFVRAVFSMHDPAAVAALLRGAGLHDVTSAVTRVPLRLPGPREFLWQYIGLTPLAPLVAQAPAAAQRALEEQAVAGWQPDTSGGRLHVVQPMVIAGGRRS